MKTIAIVGILFAAYLAWLVYEIMRAPLVDENGNAVSEKKTGDGNRTAEEVVGGVFLLFAMSAFMWLCCVGSGYNWQ